MINVQNFSLKLDDLEIFKDISFEIKENQINIIAGPNGAGKTTLIKALAGIIKKYKGKISKSTNKIFYLPQKIIYPKSLTLWEYLSSIFYSSNWKWLLSKDEKEQIVRVLEELELSHKQNLDIEKLSAGELQKANIALALLSDAKLLLLDEPTSNMDLINQMKVLETLKHLKTRGITSLIILHDLNLASNYGDYFIGISTEHKLFTLKKNEFFTKEILKKVYNLEFEIINNEKNIFIQTFN